MSLKIEQVHATKDDFPFLLEGEPDFPIPRHGKLDREEINPLCRKGEILVPAAVGPPHGRHIRIPLDEERRIPLAVTGENLHPHDGHADLRLFVESVHEIVVGIQGCFLTRFGKWLIDNLGVG